MKKIASFTVNHINLFPGVYVSRRDKTRSGDVVTTFDLRFKAPNREPVMDMPALHTIEHLGATFLRNYAEWSERIIYFGPMGCRTGFYVILDGELESSEILGLVKEMLQFIGAFEGEIPGAKPAECGNYSEQNLNMAKYEAEKYLQALEQAGGANLVYPE